MYSTNIGDGMFLCSKKGVVTEEGKCRKFYYDPLRRTPVKPKAQNFDKFNFEDFKL